MQTSLLHLGRVLADWRGDGGGGGGGNWTRAALGEGSNSILVEGRMGR